MLLVSLLGKINFLKIQQKNFMNIKKLAIPVVLSILTGCTYGHYQWDKKAILRFGNHP